MKHKLITIVLAFVIGFTFAQQKESKLITNDGETGEALPFCHVCIRDLETNNADYFVTDGDGLAKFTFSGKAIISVSFMGYKTIIDTIVAYRNEISYTLETQSFNFDEVVVTGQNSPISVDKSIYNIKLIGKQEIEQTASTNLTELLSKQANIQINNDPSTGSSLKLQGISGENIKILVDGVPVIGRLNGSVDLSQINLSEVDHVEIVNGPMSVIYGSNALGGVINIITKENKYASLKAGADLYYESVGIYNANGNIYWKKDKNAAGATFGRNFFQGFSVDPNTRYMEWKPKEQYNASTHYSYSTEDLILKGKLDGFKEKLLDRNNPSAPYYINGTDTWYYTNRLTGSLQGDYQLSELNSFKTLFSYSYYDRAKEKYFKDLRTLETVLSPNSEDQDTSIFNAITARGTYNRRTISDVLEYQMGFDINWEDAKGKRIFNEYEKMADYAAFLILKWKATAKLMIQPALRIAHNTKYDAPLVPSINFKYSWDKNSLRLSYARGFRAPSLKELYLFFYDSNHQIEGNPDLKAENSHNFNLAYNGHVLLKEEPFEYKLTLYYNQIFNKIALIQVDEANDLHYRNENIDKFESVGGTFGISFTPVKYIHFDAAYAATGRRDNSSGLSDFYFSSDATANLDFNFLQNTANIAFNYKYVGKYPVYTNYGTNGEINVSYMDDYHNLDINISKKFYRNTLRISTGVKNIFDNIQLNSAAGSGGGHGSSGGGTSALVGWGRTVFVSLKYNFTKYDK
ncbi:TonB-dependent receptor [Lentimicrobium sp. L6]|uniref:TonB-dependent receptor n=1 Tax=Lentimicrobium sp. L6 TaxID=2735916 RepID=UPI0015549A67|nr:TonB-dependent receptor [Lentimicrobium sp. L6]NPD86527.1 TonB-dependent receptor [Lentimicrobium sp. L6]